MKETNIENSHLTGSLGGNREQEREEEGTNGC